MKVAVCLFGRTGNVKGKVTLGEESCSEIIDVAGPRFRDNIIGPNNADVFVHTWDTHCKGPLLGYLFVVLLG